MTYEVIIPDELENEFRKFLDDVDNRSGTKITKELDLLERYGVRLGMPYAKRIDKVIWELRTTGQQKVRILYCIFDEKIYILNRFLKKTKKLPIRELETAHKRLTFAYHR